MDDYSDLEIAVHGVEDDGSLTEPIRAKVCRLSLNLLTGAPELKFTVVGGTLEEFKAQWKKVGSYEGWIAVDDD